MTESSFALLREEARLLETCDIPVRDAALGTKLGLLVDVAVAAFESDHNDDHEYPAGVGEGCEICDALDALLRRGE